MKVAVSIPDELFERTEQLRRQEKRSRSNVYASALAEYVARHAPDQVTEAMNRVWDEVSPDPDEFILSASRSILEHSEW